MKIFLERQYSHRYPGALVGAVLLVAMGGFTLWGLFKSLWTGEMPDFRVGIALLALLLICGAGLFLCAGGMLAYGWLTNRTDRLTITDEGIWHFGKFTHWNKIKWLSCGCKRKGELMLFYQRVGLGFDRYLPVTEPLSEVEIEALFQELKPALEPKYQNLRIG
jgi:hypothetical protein